ncbi:retropepsin-like aspartic protease [Neptunomonas antarctica]|uniref:Clan AA aspartic protease, TIGR02281 family n=1 Tax=Neptunomonas antarctica TaxID=619304 RepID=A0A1N7M6K6_9GAMM|nr:retropepsin-like aspartic protease [Neptunomonas antarctica]SIS81756.1 clan AA aspartic protease, TIGR02281 family [Neptunomonas antarctica]
MAKKKCVRCQQIRMVAIFVSMIAILLLLMMAKSHAEIYKYTDDSGKQIFVGSMSQVPQKYQLQIELQAPSDEVSNSSHFSEKNKKASASLKAHSTLKRLERALVQMETPVTILKNQVLVPVSLTYHGKNAHVNMLMDTGATNTVFHRDALARLDTTSQAAGYARVAGGSVIKVSSIEFDRIKVGPFQVKNIRSFVIDNKAGDTAFDGLLGMDFLMNVKYELNPERKVIIWNPARYKAMEALLKEMQSTP